MATTRTIQLRTEIPGPRSREIVERAGRAVAKPLALTFPIVADSARGVTITDVDGNTFIDFAGGVGTLNVGHSHPDVVAAAQEQLDRFSHTDYTIVPYEVYVTLAERLGALVPISGPVKAAFFNAGTEAVENAVKFARLATKRSAVIASRAPSTDAPCSRSRSPRRRSRTRRGSARSRPRSTACRSRTSTAASPLPTRSPRSTAPSRRRSRRRRSRRSSSSRCRARAASSSRRPSS